MCGFLIGLTGPPLKTTNRGFGERIEETILPRIRGLTDPSVDRDSLPPEKDLDLAHQGTFEDCRYCLLLKSQHF